MAGENEHDEGASRHAARFKRVRDAHQTEVAEDYVELIGDLIEETGEARVVDLAQRLGVSNATVNNTIQRLQRDGLVTSKPYRSIFLTEEGQELAVSSRERHRLVRDFLIALGVDRHVADADAEGIEHHVSDATLEAFRAHLVRGRRRRK
jgi:DtxR family manganese transport transcriptional regulator